MAIAKRRKRNRHQDVEASELQDRTEAAGAEISETPSRERLDKQVSFYCTTEFSKKIHAEKVRRGLTIQEMITKALAEYFNRPPVDEVRADRAAFFQKLRRDGRAPAAEDPDYERSVWFDLCVKYFQRMPKAKRQILEEFIMLDLKHYGSSRLKKD
jgi:hypothetical protein